MKTTKRLLLAVMGLAALSATSAIAADLGGGYKDAPVYDTDSGRALMIRGRLLWIVPGAGMSEVLSHHPDSDVIAATGVTSEISISNEVVPELDISYFFSRNLAVELILGATEHDITASKALYDVTGSNIGSTWLLPPTLMLQYHFDLNSTLKPYIGAGVNYTFFFDERAGGGIDTLKLDNNWGWALQAGIDIHIAGPWYANLDVKKLWLDTDATITAGDHIYTTKVDVDPWIVGVSLGYKFDRSPAPLK